MTGAGEKRRPDMRSLLVASMISASALVAVACGGSGADTRRAAKSVARVASARGAQPTGISEAPPHYPGVRQEAGDDDGDGDRNSDENIRTFGHRVGGVAERAIAATARRYFVIAAQNRGARACSMFTARFRRAVPIDYGLHGSPYLRAKTCAAVMTRFFEHFHRQILEFAARSKTIEARLEGEAGYAVLSMHAMCPPSLCVASLHTLHIAHVLVQREGGSWKIESMLFVV